MSTTRPGQAAFEVAYLGPPGTYSHQVALGLYPDYRDNQASSSKVTLIPYDTITQTAASILSASAPRRLALLPLKNSTHGIVKETEEFLASSPVPVETIKTVELAVRHALLVNSKTYERLQQVKDSDRPLSDEALKSIEKVYSHEQALGQCRHFLDSHLPLTSSQDGRINVSSTALAASMIAKDDSGTMVAALASDICATKGIYEGLKVARAGVQDRDDNVTTFILVRAREEGQR
ncbi:Prephenate dehydratase [Jaminaea rosea]|uniref:Prephenate dehydratase n=1 Tax=Jaminaea rosea TaxID=1569628 RepID=A0A316V248_9BASI|nr:Prephenate dehydratase [Jaminaea rosea]PWN29495.1 Prephenate dehydratase [Jaminaea rosea]